jgi:hypothetical protein
MTNDQNLSSYEVAKLLGTNLSKIDNFEDCFLESAVTASELPQVNTINPIFLPEVDSTLLEDLNQAAVKWLKETGCTKGIDQLLSIPFDSINFEQLIAKLAEHVIPGQWNFISFSGNFLADCSPSDSEVGLIFDTETFVTSGNKPIIATVISCQGLYIWVSQSWDGKTEYVPEYVDLSDCKRLLVAHNIAFDYCRVKQRFQIDNPVYGLCTMALAKSQFAIDRKSQWLLKADPEVNKAVPLVKKIACQMSLVEVYQFITGRQLPKNIKETRNLFVAAKDFSEFLPTKLDLFAYALTDTVLTLEVFQNLFPQFVEWSKTPIILQGLIQAADSLLPVAQDYDKWLSDSFQAVEQVNYLLFKKLKPTIDEIHESWLAGTINPLDYPESLFKLDWRLSKPAGWRKRSLPDGWPKMAKWFFKFMGGQFSWGGLDLAYILQLSWAGQQLKYKFGAGWFYTDKYTGLVIKVPHPNGSDSNLGTITSGSCLTYVEQNLLTSKVFDKSDLLEIYKLLDSTSIIEGYGQRLSEIKIL